MGRRSFNRTRDWVLLGVLSALLIVWAVVTWRTSDLRATTSETAPGAPLTPAAPVEFPLSLGEVWRAESPATPVPAVTGPTVVTAGGNEVQGRDPRTGDVRWRYARDLTLCTVAPIDTVPPQRLEVPRNVIALYGTDGGLLPAGDSRVGGGCSEATSLDGGTGARAAARHLDSEFGTRLFGDGDHVTSTGARFVINMRSDLVTASYYGTRPTIVWSRPNLRKGCAYGSMGLWGGRAGVIERCPGEAGDRLTVYRVQTAPGKDPDEVEEVFSLLTGPSARLVAMTDSHIAIALPDPARVVVFDQAGQQVGEYPVQVPDGELRADPPGRVVSGFLGGSAFYWHTGTVTVALSRDDLRPLWRVEGALGAGVEFAGRLLVPRAGELAVVDPVSGAVGGRFPVDRGDHTGPVAMSTIGPIVLEQRGSTLVALR
ncbi:hypothetical protein CLV40_109175 [Actinokineospora auranticolor]|uniref:Pyrroloquinoline-quinone binding quinoprotein n=1 Tax=Actinokineospora auranticolor TaxID=155976 RepID=A0A2S6GNM8_9PSEU|nr:hypothetical protein CLV40_109175 [Actinokineospora auranticolor]